MSVQNNGSGGAKDNELQLQFGVFFKLMIYLIIIASITACGPNDVNENWFFTDIFHYDGIALDREIKHS